MGKRVKKPPAVLICLQQQGPRWRMLRDRMVALPEWKNLATGEEQLSEDEIFMKFLLDRFEQDLEATDLMILACKEQKMERSSSEAKMACDSPTPKTTQEHAQSTCPSKLPDESLENENLKSEITEDKKGQSGTRNEVPNHQKTGKVGSEMEDSISTYQKKPQDAGQELPEICLDRLDFACWFCPENELRTEATDRDTAPRRTSDTQLVTMITAAAEIADSKNKRRKSKEQKLDDKGNSQGTFAQNKKEVSRVEMDAREREAMEFNKSLKDVQEDDLPQMLSCRNCGDRFRDADEVRIHTVTAHLPFSMPEGSETTTSDESGKLQSTHIKIDLGSYQQVNEADIQELAISLRCCPLCTEYVENVKTHMDVHMQKNCICEVCEKGFASNTQLKSHTVHHEASETEGVNGMLYSCDFCNKTFRTKQSLSIHRQLHNKARNYVCQFCGKAFKANTRLQKHLGTHDKQKRYCCAFCGRGFVQKCNMARHERTHTGEKPYPCHKCNQAFNHNVSLKKHLKKEHLIRLEEKNLQTVEEIDNFPIGRMPLKRTKLK